MIAGSAAAQLFQQIQVIADGNGGNFGDLPAHFLGKDIGQVDVGAVGQCPYQPVFVTGHVDCTARLTNVHGDGAASEINDLGNLIPIHVGDLADLSAGNGEAQIMEVVGDTVRFLLHALEPQLAIHAAYPKDQLVGQHIEALAGFGIGIEQVVGKPEIGVLANDTADISEVIAVTGQEHIHICVVLELCHHLAGRLNGQVHFPGFGGDLAQSQLGIIDRVDLTIRVLTVQEHVSDICPDVTLRLHGDVGIPLGLGDKVLVIRSGDLCDIRVEGVLPGADAARPGDGELVGPELGAGCGVQKAAVHADIHDALCHILIQNGTAVDSTEDYIPILFGYDAEAGQLMRILGAEEVDIHGCVHPVRILGNDEADVQIGSGLLAVDEGYLVDIQISVRAVGDYHIGQEAAVINGDQFAGILRYHFILVTREKQLDDTGRSLLLAHIGLRSQGAAVIIVKTVEIDGAAAYSAHVACLGEALVIQTGVVQFAVFIDIHEAACRGAAKVEPAVENDVAAHTQCRACNGFLTSVIGLTEGKDLDHPLGDGVSFGLGAAVHNAGAVYTGCACHDLHVLTCHIRHRGDIDLRHNSVGAGAVRTVDPDIGLGSCLAACALDVCGSRSRVFHFGGFGLNVKRINTAKEHIVEPDDLLVVHGVDIRVGSGGGASGNRGGSCVGVELLNDVGNHLGDPCVDIGLNRNGVVCAQGDVGGGFRGHIRFTPVAARNTDHIPVSVRGSPGGVGGLHQQFAEEGSDLSARPNAYCGFAGLHHSGLGALASVNDAAAVHVKIGVHIRQAVVTAEDFQITVAGRESRVLADGDALAAGPLHADACLAIRFQAHTGGVDDSVEIHMGIGLQGDVVSGFRVRALAHGHRAVLAHVHVHTVCTAGDGANAVVVQPGIGLHLVIGLNKKIVAREDLAVQVSTGRLFFHSVFEYVSANLGQAYAGGLVGTGIHLGIGFRVDGNVACGVDDSIAAHTRLSIVARYDRRRLNNLRVHTTEAVFGNLRLGNQLGYLPGGAGVSLNADAARLDICVSVNGRFRGHTHNLGLGKNHTQRRQAGRCVVRLRPRGDCQPIGLRQNLHRAGGIDGNIAPDGGGVAHLSYICIRPLIAAGN